jgi:hypothetical protein
MRAPRAAEGTTLMSSTLLKRTLGVAGVTGGLLLVGTGVALADDATTTDSFGLTQGSGEAGVEAPVSVGGISLGLSGTSTQSSGSTTSTTTDDGTAVATQEGTSSTSSDLGIEVGEIALDPSALLSGSAATQQGSGDDAVAGAGQAAGAAEVAAPVSVGGVAVTGSTTTEDTSAHGSTVTDDDGAAVTEGATSTSGSTTTGTLGLGATTLDPAAMLDGSAWSAGSATDAGDDAAAGSAGTAGDVDVTSPVNLGGLTAGVTDERRGTDERWTMRADADGDAVWTRTESERSSATTAGISTGELTADPASWLSGTTGQAFGADDEVATSGARSAGDLGVAAPVTFGGAQGRLIDERSSRVATTDGSRADDVVRESTSERADATRTGGTLGLGELAVLPELTGSTGSAARSTSADEDGAAAGTSDGALDLTAPFRFDGAWLAGTAQSARSARDTDVLTTDEGSTSTSTWSSTADRVDPSLATGPVQGDLAGWAWGELTALGSTR